MHDVCILCTSPFLVFSHFSNDEIQDDSLEQDELSTNKVKNLLLVRIKVNLMVLGLVGNHFYKLLPLLLLMVVKCSTSKPSVRFAVNTQMKPGGIQGLNRYKC